MKIFGVSGRRAQLEAIRDRLAQFLDGDIGHRNSCECECGVPPDLRTLPSAAKEYRELIRELDELPATGGVSELDELSAARKARQEEAVRRAAATNS
jgi:hypothetical protein